MAIMPHISVHDTLPNQRKTKKKNPFIKSFHLAFTQFFFFNYAIIAQEV